MPFAWQKDGDGNIILFTISASKPHNFNKMRINWKITLLICLVL